MGCTVMLVALGTPHFFAGKLRYIREYSYLCACRSGLHVAAMKRETGESPVQSRCCEFHRRKHKMPLIR